MTEVSRTVWHSLMAPRWLAGIGAGRAARPALLIAAFSLLTILMTWPLASRAGDAIQDLGDPLYEIWSMRWTQHQLLTDPAHLWDGNILHPFPRTLLFAEPTLSTAILAWPVQLATGNDVLTYNIILLATFVVLGVGMALLVEELSANAGAGLLAGVLAAYTPYRFGHISHLNLLGYGWLPLALWALVRYARRRRRSDAVLGGLFLTIQFLTSDTLAAMALGTVVLTLPFLLWPERHHLTPRFLGGLVLVLAIPLLAIVPVLSGRYEVNARYGFARDLDNVRQLSASPTTYLSVGPRNHFWRATLPQDYPSPLFPGAVAALGAALGLVLALTARGRSRWILYALTLAAVGVVLSLGPQTTVAGKTVTLPYRWLYDTVPGVALIRDTTRFGTVALLGIQLLAGLGFAAAWAPLRARLPQRLIRPIGAAALAFLLGAGLLECRNEVGAVEVPRDPETVAVYDWLARQPPGAVMEFPANGHWADLTQTSRQMYYSTRHWHPIVGGYTSFLPERYIAFLTRFHGGEAAFSGAGRTISEVSAANVGLLQDLDVRYVIIHRASGYDWRRTLAEAQRLPELTRLGDFGAATAYALDPGQRAPARFALAAPDLAIAGGEVVAALIARNDNASSAVGPLDAPAVANASWQDAAGRQVGATVAPVALSVLDPGLTGLPLRIAAPAHPGRYRLLLRYGALAEPLATMVEVRPPQSATGDGPPVVLRGASWPGGEYLPGDTVDLLVMWEVRGRLDTSYTVAVQLLGSDNQLAGQWDARPFRDRYPTVEWRPQTTIVEPVSLRVAPGADPGHYRVLVALYDTAGKRLAVELPEGTSATEGVFESLVVLEP